MFKIEINIKETGTQTRKILEYPQNQKQNSEENIPELINRIEEQGYLNVAIKQLENDNIQLKVGIPGYRCYPEITSPEKPMSTYRRPFWVCTPKPNNLTEFEEICKEKVECEEDFRRQGTPVSEYLIIEFDSLEDIIEVLETQGW